MKQFKLLKDLPYCKAGAIYEWEDDTYINKSPELFTDGTKWDGLGKEAVEKAMDGWFEEVKEQSVDTFVWDAVKVVDLLEFCRKFGGLPYDTNNCIKDFLLTQSKQQTIEPIPDETDEYFRKSEQEIVEDLRGDNERDWEITLIGRADNKHLDTYHEQDINKAIEDGWFTNNKFIIKRVLRKRDGVTFMVTDKNISLGVGEISGFKIDGNRMKILSKNGAGHWQYLSAISKLPSTNTEVVKHTEVKEDVKEDVKVVWFDSQQIQFGKHPHKPIYNIELSHFISSATFPVIVKAIENAINSTTERLYTEREILDARQDAYHYGYLQGWMNGCFDDDKTMSKKITQEKFNKYMDNLKTITTK